MELRSSQRIDSYPSATSSEPTTASNSQEVSTPSSKRANQPPASHPSELSTSTSATGSHPSSATIPTGIPTRTQRKRKAPSTSRTSEVASTQPSQPHKKARSTPSNPSPAEPRPTKSPAKSRRKGVAATNSEDMADQGSSSNTPIQNTTLQSPTSTSSSKKKQRRSKKSDTSAPIPAPAPTPSQSKNRKQGNEEPPPVDNDTTMEDSEKRVEEKVVKGGKEDKDGRASTEEHSEEEHDEEMKERGAEGDSDDEEGEDHDYDRDEDDEDDGYDGSFFGSGNMPGTLRALQQMMGGGGGSGVRFRDLLANLRQKEDQTAQLFALSNLSEILLVSTEENLSGHFSPDAFIKELVSLMKDPGPFGEENPEIMLLACRCLANLMEALPASTANVLYGGAVPVLCDKLVEISYIDLAEQALSTLEKISVEYPTSIVREGGLTACLSYLEFFATNVQRTAVTTAANCCRNIPDDCFETVLDVMPILLNVLRSSDQRVVEQGCLCVARIADSFRHRPEKLEKLMSASILKAILGLLLPGTTNLVGPHIHTQFLRLIGNTAKASPALSVELFKMNIVDTLHQILTGVSAPADNDVASLRNDRVMIMQALIHRPREQVYETLNVICELLPGMPQEERILPFQESEDPEKKAKRLELLEGCKDKLKHFAVVLLPTLTDAYSSTVNLNVRQKVLDAQLKMIANLDASILQEALTNVPFASYLASILSQNDHPTLVLSAIQASELLLRRLPDIYRYHFHREGVVAEVLKLSERDKKEGQESEVKEEAQKKEAVQPDDEHMSDSEESRSSDDEPEDHMEDTEVVDWIAVKARSFIEALNKDETGNMKGKATDILEELGKLADELRTTSKPHDVFERMAEYFQSSTALQSISSFELLNSGIVESLLAVLSEDPEPKLTNSRRAFLEVFMRSLPCDGPVSASPFSVLVSKLQDLLSRSEHFEVVTVHQNSYDGNRSSATSMLAKQLRLKLIAEDETDIPRSYRQIMVSIHAIATFKALEEYLRPRISLSDRKHHKNVLAAAAQAMAASSAAGSSNHGRDMSSVLAAFAAATGFQEGASGTSTPGLLPGRPLNEAEAESLAKRQKRKGDRERLMKTLEDGAAASGSTAAEKSPQKEPQDAEDGHEPLECMDEKQLSDQGSDINDMEGMMDDFDDDMDDESMPDVDPTVNMEMEKGGVTARKEDGTKVQTPAGASSSRADGLASATSRLASYAAALQAPPDWHIEFSINGQVITNDTTVYKAVMMGNRQANGEINYRSVWSSVYSIKFRKAPGPPPPDSPLSPTSLETTSEPNSIDKSTVSYTILHLLSVLHDLNSNLDDLFTGDQEVNKPSQKESLSQFMNTKLTAKLNRQLEEPLIVASACLPGWSEDLARLYPFLFPFETRHLFLQSTSFGYSRSMTRWQNSQSASDSRQDRRDDRPYLGRLQRQKVRISRNRILESAVKVMELYGASPSILEVEYFEEVGTGLGPTLEFYSSVSKELAQKKLKLWRESNNKEGNEYVFAEQGLFPAPMSNAAADTESGKKILHFFKVLGIFVARSMLDSRIIDISFNPTFFKICSNSMRTVRPSLGTVKTVDKFLSQTLAHLQKFAVAKKTIINAGLSITEQNRRLQEVTVDGQQVEDLGLCFVLYGYDIELIPGGKNIDVTIYNVDDYVDKVIDATLGSGVRRQLEAFKAGFSQVFPYSALRAFTPEELVMLFGQVDEDWSIETLTDSIKADHGFNMDSKSVRNLLHVMSNFNSRERRDFLQFVTGSPKLPIGGFKSLTPMLTVVCKPSEPPLTSDDYLPSVMTCVNYLKMPDYSNMKVMREKLITAIREGQGAFHLS